MNHAWIVSLVLAIGRRPDRVSPPPPRVPCRPPRDRWRERPMAQLRHKLERDPTRPRLLIMESGVGYRVRDGES